MYEVLAHYYDLFSVKQDWIEFAVRAVKGKGKGADVGCGTGNVALALSQEHEVVAIDSSREMLSIASEKFLKAGKKIPVVLQKAENFKLNFKAEFITAMCDVVNYIKEPLKFFKAAYDNLKEGGSLVFDISSEYKLKSIISNNTFSETRDEVTYIWENFPHKDHVDMTVTFFIPAGNGLFKKAVDVQRQYIHSSKKIQDALEECGFSFKTRDKSDRIYFVARKDTK